MVRRLLRRSKIALVINKFRSTAMSTRTPLGSSLNVWAEMGLTAIDTTTAAAMAISSAPARYSIFLLESMANLPQSDVAYIKLRAAKTPTNPD